MGNVVSKPKLSPRIKPTSAKQLEPRTIFGKLVVKPAQKNIIYGKNTTTCANIVAIRFHVNIFNTLDDMVTNQNYICKGYYLLQNKNLKNIELTSIKNTLHRIAMLIMCDNNGEKNYVDLSSDSFYQNIKEDINTIKCKLNQRFSGSDWSYKWISLY